MVGHGGSSAGSYLADPTTPIPSHCAVIILFKSVSVHQLSCLALKELIVLLMCGSLNISYSPYNWFHSVLHRKICIYDEMDFTLHVVID